MTSQKEKTAEEIYLKHFEDLGFVPNSEWGRRCIDAMKEYAEQVASLRVKELQEKNQAWISKVRNILEYVAQLESEKEALQDEIIKCDSEIARLREALEGIERFLPSLKAIVDAGFNSPDNCLAALDKIEQALNSKP